MNRIGMFFAFLAVAILGGFVGSSLNRPVRAASEVRIVVDGIEVVPAPDGTINISTVAPHGYHADQYQLFAHAYGNTLNFDLEPPVK